MSPCVMLQRYIYNNPIFCYKWAHVEPNREIVDDGSAAQNSEGLGGRQDKSPADCPAGTHLPVGCGGFAQSDHCQNPEDQPSDCGAMAQAI